MAEALVIPMRPADGHSARDIPLTIAGVTSHLGLSLPEGLPRDQWEAIGRDLRGVEHSVMWWVGDWLNYGEREYGETYSEAVKATGYSYDTCRQAKWVSSEFPELCGRQHNLSFSHHLEAARLPTESRAEFLTACADNGWSHKDARAEVNRRKNAVGAIPSSRTCCTADLGALAAGETRYGTIYADPPWQYSNQGTRAATGNHYKGMSVDEIAALPVAALAAENAHLHLWTTNAFLFECRRIMEEWGFTYKSCFVWVKPQMGIGNYWRVSHEFMLFGVRGKAPFADRALKSWAEIPRGAHSAKPEQVRGMIERASPSPRLELFGRRAAPGWTVWGDQIESSIFTAAAEWVQ